jgi:hypothetical protein
MPKKDLMVPRLNNHRTETWKSLRDIHTLKDAV